VIRCTHGLALARVEPWQEGLCALWLCRPLPFLSSVRPALRGAAQRVPRRGHFALLGAGSSGRPTARSRPVGIAGAAHGGMPSSGVLASGLKNAELTDRKHPRRVPQFGLGLSELLTVPLACRTRRTAERVSSPSPSANLRCPAIVPASDARYPACVSASTYREALAATPRGSTVPTGCMEAEGAR
jgi:hypothetical protein